MFNSIFSPPPPPPPYPPLACSRLQDSGEKSFGKKKCEKRAGAGVRQAPLYYLKAWHRLPLPKKKPKRPKFWLVWCTLKILPNIWVVFLHRALHYYQLPSFCYMFRLERDVILQKWHRQLGKKFKFCLQGSHLWPVWLLFQMLYH